ncbi:HNH endonuclease signature motif containing protein [Mycobacterium kyorinense]|uniref:HNH endonuclease signature motif containing protein n=1 Tax=Mycobacterium kyorinense TaxID=487514 RepID=UPI001F405625|nr:HNH endonuclease signature motif containing protein [Mycobacterium kyorinense]
MFDIGPSLQVTGCFADADDAAVIDAITSAARAQNAMCGRELAAIGELYARRAPEDDVDRQNWAIDGHENVVAEVAAALGISRAVPVGGCGTRLCCVSGCLWWLRLSRRGAIDFRVMAAVVCRTELVEDPVLIAKIDAAIARHGHRWMRLSEPKLFERIDMWVARFDPAAQRVPGERNQDRYVEIGPVQTGLAGIWAQVQAHDGAALDHKLDALASTVCPNDPRTKAQRRADALGALAAGLDVMRCECGSVDCAAAARNPGADVMIHVFADQSSVKGESQAPGFLPGFGPVPAPVLRNLAATAKLKPVVKPSADPEPGYRPSAALAEFVRLRDLTCRFPGCDLPAECCDIDHTVPFPLGPTHPSNLKLLCRYHQRLAREHFRVWAGQSWSAPPARHRATRPQYLIAEVVLHRRAAEVGRDAWT